LVFSATSFHFPQSWTQAIQFLIFIWQISCVMLSSHLYLGLPCDLLVRGFQLNIFLIVLVSGILCIRPYQLSHRWCQKREFLLTPPMKKEQCVPKRRHIKFRHRRMPQEKGNNKTKFTAKHSSWTDCESVSISARSNFQTNYLQLRPF
jgi:hypothetical protein